MTHTSSRINGAPVSGTGRNSDQFPLRLPDGMRQALKIRAASNRRTMNAEVIILIEKGIAVGVDNSQSPSGEASK